MAVPGWMFLFRVQCTSRVVFTLCCSVIDRVHLVISHSNGSWPRKSERHLCKTSLNNSVSSTLSTEPHRTATNRTERSWVCGHNGAMWRSNLGGFDYEMSFEEHVCMKKEKTKTQIHPPVCLLPGIRCSLCGVKSLTDLFFRYRGHQTSQHGRSNRGDNSSRVSPPPLSLVCVQQQQGHPASLWHESIRTLRQTRQTWACCRNICNLLFCFLDW